MPTVVGCLNRLRKQSQRSSLIFGASRIEATDSLPRHASPANFEIISDTFNVN
jgi:hypothetical protein